MTTVTPSAHLYFPSLQTMAFLTAAADSLSRAQFDCCGVGGPEDFEESLFRLLSPKKMVPEACCQRNGYLGDLGVEQCVSGGVAFRHNKVESETC